VKTASPLALSPLTLPPGPFLASLHSVADPLALRWFLLHRDQSLILRFSIFPSFHPLTKHIRWKEGSNCDQPITRPLGSSWEDGTEPRARFPSLREGGGLGLGCKRRGGGVVEGVAKFHFFEPSLRPFRLKNFPLEICFLLPPVCTDSRTPHGQLERPDPEAFRHFRRRIFSNSCQ